MNEQLWYSGKKGEILRFFRTSWLIVGQSSVRRKCSSSGQLLNATFFESKLKKKTHGENETTFSQTNGSTQKKHLCWDQDLRPEKIAGLRGTSKKPFRSWKNPSLKQRRRIFDQPLTTQANTPAISNVHTFTQDHVTHHHVTLQRKGKHPQAKLGQRPPLMTISWPPRWLTW